MFANSNKRIIDRTDESPAKRYKTGESKVAEIKYPKDLVLPKDLTKLDEVTKLQIEKMFSEQLARYAKYKAFIDPLDFLDPVFKEILAKLYHQRMLMHFSGYGFKFLPLTKYSLSFKSQIYSGAYSSASYYKYLHLKLKDTVAKFIFEAHDKNIFLAPELKRFLNDLTNHDETHFKYKNFILSEDNLCLVFQGIGLYPFDQSYCENLFAFLENASSSKRGHIYYKDRKLSQTLKEIILNPILLQEIINGKEAKATHIVSVRTSGTLTAASAPALFSLAPDSSSGVVLDSDTPVLIESAIDSVSASAGRGSTPSPLPSLDAYRESRFSPVQGESASLGIAVKCGR